MLQALGSSRPAAGSWPGFGGLAGCSQGSFHTRACNRYPLEQGLQRCGASRLPAVGSCQADCLHGQPTPFCRLFLVFLTFQFGPMLMS